MGCVPLLANRTGGGVPSHTCTRPCTPCHMCLPPNPCMLCPYLCMSPSRAMHAPSSHACPSHASPSHECPLKPCIPPSHACHCHAHPLPSHASPLGNRMTVTNINKRVTNNLGVCICYTLAIAISIAGLQCPGHDALTALYTPHGEVMHISDLVFMRTRESPNQCLVVTCCHHLTFPGQSHQALLHFRYCILSHITTPLVSVMLLIVIIAIWV